MADENSRHTPEEWQARLPSLKRVGSQLQGPCPSCGGEDRFHVSLAEPHLFGCRQCKDGPGILSAVFGVQPEDGEAPAQRRARRPNSDFLIATYETAAGKKTDVYRKDWPWDWPGESCDFRGCKDTLTHKHIWRGPRQPSRNLLLLLWPPPDPVDAALVVICEGEKAAKAIQDAGYTGASYCGGVPAGAMYADYSPVANRPVLVWPDADEAGINAGQVAAERATLAEAFGVWVMSVQEAEGQDAADYDMEDIRRLVAEALEKTDPVEAPDVGQDIQGAPSKVQRYIDPDQHGLRSILDYLHLDVRENPRNLGMEIRRTGTPGDSKSWAKQWTADTQPGGWIPLNDSIEASLRQNSRQHFTFHHEERSNRPATWIDRDLSDAFLNNCPRPAVDPFRTWLEELPSWDGQERIARLWIDTLAVPDTELNREAGSRFLIGAVRRAYEPACIHDWIPVLVGPQGLGKSSILRELVSPAREWFSDGTQLDGTPKERMETTGPAVISEFSEMAGMDRADASAFKSWLVRRDDTLRPAYARHAVQTPRRWVGVGTANPDPDGVLPGDPTGSRRYVVMVSGYDGAVDALAAAASRARVWVRTHLKQLWAEALRDYRTALKRADDGMNLIPGHLRSAQEAAAEGMQRQSEGLREVARQLIPFGQEYEKGRGYGPTIAELMVEARLADSEGDAAKDNSTQRAFGKELTSAGWAKRQRMVSGVISRRWYAPLPLDEALVKPEGRCASCGLAEVRLPYVLCADCADRAYAEHLAKPAAPLSGQEPLPLDGGQEGADNA